MNIMDKCNLVMMNLDHSKTTGEVTWERGIQKSTIDYVLVSFSLYDRVKSMIIDDNHQILKISDHNLICLNIEIKKGKKCKYQEYETYEYFKMSDDRVKKLIELFRGNLLQIDSENIEKFEDYLKECCSKSLKVNVKRKKHDDNKIEPEWFNKSIKKEISNKRNLNKQIRKSTNNDQKIGLEILLKEKKIEIKQLVYKEVSKHEMKVTKEIIESKDRSKKLFEHIRCLKGEKKKQSEIIIYDETGQKLEDDRLKFKLSEKWKGILGAYPNKSFEEWDSNIRAKYNRQLGQERITLVSSRGNVNDHGGMSGISFHPSLIEHMEYAFSIHGKYIHKMEEVKISIEDIKRQIKKMKNNKAPGPDKIKIEIYKAITEKEDIMLSLCNLFNKVLDTGDVPISWKQSKTVLIQKKKRPTIDDLIPIALTNCSYKIFMGIIRKKIESHLFANDAVDEFQSGSTVGRRVQDNIKILQYCIEQSFKNRKTLYILAIDFQKAFDSVDRKKLINILKNYKIDSKIIDIIYKIYKNDQTNLYLNSEEYAKINIETGIRQGCSCSGLLFNMITYFIIDQLQRSHRGYKDSDFLIPGIFYADDGIIMAHSRAELSNLLSIVEDSSRQCGLNLNRDKCKIICFNTEDRQQLEGIQIVEEIRYLGITVQNKKRWFKNQISNNFNKGTKLCNYMYSIIGGSCNRLLIGKTFWKVLTLPSILFNQEILIYNSEDLNQLQRLENKAYRTILNLPVYTATEFLRGEIGASSFIARDIKYKLLYYKYARTETNNSLLREIVRKEGELQTSWFKTIKKYMNKVNIAEEQLFTESKDMIKKHIDVWDTLQWREGMENKSTLSIYRNFKTDIQEESWFFNGKKASIMMKARSDTLMLNWREFGMESVKTCKLCCCEVETLVHFILDCNCLQEVRSRYVELQRPMVENKSKLIALILLLDRRDGASVEYYVNMLWDIWCARKFLMNDTIL